MPPTTPKEREDEFRDAVLKLVAARGYDRVTMDEVAARTRASKTTLYRRWPSKADFVVDALRQRSGLLDEPADTGSLREDLIEMVTALAEGLAEDVDMAISLLAAARHDPRLMRVLQESVNAPRERISRLPLQRAVERGELPADTDTLMASRIASPILLHRAAWDEGPLDRAFATELVDQVLLPLLRR